MILAIDQGTTGTTTIVYDSSGKIVAKAYAEIKQIYPQPGWVEHDPIDIWNSITKTISEVCKKVGSTKIQSIGITNQRETVVVWNKKTGKPVHNAIVWQCRRTTDMCKRLMKHKKKISQKTGLPVDAYFSGTKIRWILDTLESTEDILCGTIDSWLIWNLTNGKVHATDYTNASRTMLFNIQTKKWDAELCKLLAVPISILPTVKKSADNYAVVESIPALFGIPITGVVGDQQGSLFGQQCVKSGQIKNTYGTGCFIMLNTGKKKIHSKHLITTLAVDELGNPCYALEGSIFIAGAIIQWLRDEMKLITHSAECEQLALQVTDTAGVYVVPAFVGLGAPYWDMEARGTIVGLTRGSSKNHIIRASIDSIAYQTNDIINCIEMETSQKISALFVDGGATKNNYLMQFQADILDKKIIRTATESTALGAAYLSGLKKGFFKNKELQQHTLFIPSMESSKRQKLLTGWKKAIRQTRTR